MTYFADKQPTPRVLRVLLCRRGTGVESSPRVEKQERRGGETPRLSRTTAAQFLECSGWWLG
jgi:hypothetical protein